MGQHLEGSKDKASKAESVRAVCRASVASPLNRFIRSPRFFDTVSSSISFFRRNSGERLVGSRWIFPERESNRPTNRRGQRVLVSTRQARRYVASRPSFTRA